MTTISYRVDGKRRVHMYVLAQTAGPARANSEESKVFAREGDFSLQRVTVQTSMSGTHLQDQIVPAKNARQDAAVSGQDDFWIAWKPGLAAAGAQITRVLSMRGSVPEPPRWRAAWARLA